MIDTEQAMESLVSLKKLVDSSIADLLNFLSTDWRSDGQLKQIDSNRNNFEVQFKNFYLKSFKFYESDLNKNIVY